MFGKKMIKTGYRSEMDTFFQEYDKNRNTFPASRDKEVAKYKEIFNKRDNPVERSKKEIWSKF